MEGLNQNDEARWKKKCMASNFGVVNGIDILDTHLRSLHIQRLNPRPDEVT